VKKIVRKASKIFTVTILIIIIIIMVGLVAGNIYKDEIRNYVISEINREIEVKVNVRSAEISVWRKFPFVSVVLTDVTALSGKDFDCLQFPLISSDTLFTASRIYLQFSIIDILNKDYRLRRVHADKGMLNILVDKHGDVNYRIFKKQNKNEENNMTLALDGVKLSSFSLHFLNLAKDIHSEGLIKDLALKGRFSQRSFSLNTLSSIYIETFNKEGIEYASKLKLDSRIILDVRDSIYTISRGDISLNDLKFIMKGSFSSGSKIVLNLQIAGENLNIKSLTSCVPVHYVAITKYSPSGNAEILAKINGEFSSTDVPSIRAAFKVSNGKIFLPLQGSFIYGIGLKGTFSNGSLHNASTSRLNFSEYSIKYGDNLMNGKLSIDNFINPFLSAEISGTFTAKDFSDVLNLEGLELEKGLIYPDLSINMNLDSFSSFRINNISANGINGNITIKGVSGKTPYSNVPLDLLEGNIKMEGKTWFPVLKIINGKNIISTNLVVNNFWEYLMGNSLIPEVNGEIMSDYLRFTDFLTESNPAEETNFHLPDSIYLNLHCKIDSFVYGKFLSSDLETWFSYKPGQLSVSSLSMNSMKGVVSTSGVIIGDNKGQMLLHAIGELHKIDINQLFYAFNNFGQDFIIAENLKGSASGKLDYSGYISPKLELITKDLIAQSDFIIQEGELINFEPITELSSFVELSELQHIKFSTLKNSVLIKDEKVYIPQMDINSSAFNISISGTHGFDNHFDYRVKLSLSEILARKAKRVKKEYEDFGIVENDAAGNTTVYLSIIGTPDDFKIKYDKKEAINNIKSDLKEEKKLLKTILKEELGMFKKDSLNSGNVNNSKQKDQFIMDWGEEKDASEKPSGKENEVKKKKKDPAFEITWDEEDPDNK
jgi:hypothetical protein